MGAEEERPPSPRAAEPAKLRLRRELGLASSVSLIAGCMIGAGIFMNPQHVLYHMGSPGGSLVIWAACGLLATLGALSYAELGTLITESGGDYVYILRTFGALPAFLVIYVSTLLVRPAGIAAMSLTFAEYVVAPFYPSCSSMPVVLVKCVAAACILILALANCRSVRLATGLMNLCTVAKVLALLVIIGGGFWVLVRGSAGDTLQNAFADTTQQLGSISIAFYQGLWSFNGWNNLNLVTEELRNSKESDPGRLGLAGAPLGGSLHLRVSKRSVFQWEPSVLRRCQGGAYARYPVHGPRPVSHPFPSSDVHRGSGSDHDHPWKLQQHCQLLQARGKVLLLLLGLWGFVLWMIHGTTISCLLYLKVKKKDLPRSYKVPIIIPVIVLLASIYLILAPIIDQPQMEFLYVFLFMLSGIVVYFPIIYFRYRPRLLQEATVQIQLFLEVAPTMKNVD
uniref:B(0,+)-type amino acid transporter 1-like isoform X3 n=1 Tax=Phascolarctos cinereus TaxID=38626 RepID=A0A6P5IPV4_PHACI|nr:b(0,+)-type amino acid transporter 1-like isoform X3 [Phascolarctos cinereus]